MQETPKNVEPSHQSTAIVAGVDGCKGGWIICSLDVHEPVADDGENGVKNGASIGVRFDAVATFAEIIARRPRISMVAVDMPIGLSAGSPRACDIEARKRLSPYRHTSVFPAPVRAVLDAGDYGDACRRSRDACGKAITKQTWHITPKIREVDACLTPARQRWIREVHPELSFAAMNEDQPVRESKHSAAGLDIRQSLLEAALGRDHFPAIRNAVSKNQVGDDDILDALAATWSAWRLHRNEGACLPEQPVRDSRGLRMEICW